MMRPAAVPSYGDRPLRVEYTPRPAHLKVDPAMLNALQWDSKGETSLEA